MRLYRRDESSVWWIDVCRGGVRLRLPGEQYKRATKRIGEQIEELLSYRRAGLKPSAKLVAWLRDQPAKRVARLGKAGLVPADAMSRAGGLDSHLVAFRKHLKAKNRSPQHIALTLSRLKALFEGVEARNIGDVTEEKVTLWLAARRAEDGQGRRFGLASSNHYGVAVKSFAAWLYRTRRWHEHALRGLAPMNAATDVRHKRRAMTHGEFAQLLAATRSGPERAGMPGEARFWLYVVASATGLRSNELRSLKVRSFMLDGSSPSVVVQAGYSKRRRRDEIGLSRETAAGLRQFFAGRHPDVAAFTLPSAPHVVRVFRADLLAAGIAYKTADGVADFHALRHRFLTVVMGLTGNLATIQRIGRLSRPDLVARYGHSRDDDVRRVIDQMPTYDVG